MPVNYGFKTPDTKERVQFSQIDTELLEALGLPPNEADECSDEFDALTWAGIATHMDGVFDATKMPPIKTAEDTKRNEVFEDFLSKRYHFFAFRG